MWKGYETNISAIFQSGIFWGLYLAKTGKNEVSYSQKNFANAGSFQRSMAQKRPLDNTLKRS